MSKCLAKIQHHTESFIPLNQNILHVFSSACFTLDQDTVCRLTAGLIWFHWVFPSQSDCHGCAAPHPAVRRDCGKEQQPALGHNTGTYAC